MAERLELKNQCDHAIVVTTSTETVTVPAGATITVFESHLAVKPAPAEATEEPTTN